MKNKQVQSYLNQLELKLDDIFVKKVPNLPPKIKEIIVMILPWLNIIGLIFMIPVVLAALGLSAMIPAVNGMNVPENSFNILSIIILLATLVLNVLAIPGLLKKQRQGWVYLFYADLVGVVATLLAFSLGGLIGTLISFYILFQIRQYYK